MDHSHYYPTLQIKHPCETITIQNDILHWLSQERVHNLSAILFFLGDY